ncbi:MAG: NHL repeat-containing protein [Gammaproteobacteria bacterium]|nr:NHL repeat-containing protein [Gammaproteobacteria bacterium]
MKFSLASRRASQASTVATAWLVLLGATLTDARAEDAATLGLLESRRMATLGPDQDGPSLPTDVVVTADGRVFVVEGAKQRVVVYDAAGRRTGQLGTGDGEAAALKDPVGIGAGPDGTLYIADRGNQRIAIFSDNGRFKTALAVHVDGQPTSPVDVAVGRDGRLYITCSNHRVMVMDPSGGVRASWGGRGTGDGEFQYPATVAIDQDGSVFVVDVINARIQKFDSEGRFLLAFGKLGATPGSLYRPKGIALAADGRLFVSDSYLGVVQVFDRSGRFLRVLGDAGKVRRWNTPVGLAVDGRGRLLVTEMLPGTVSITELEALQ